ncbi:hypothetical protein PFISCL1PPCAC_24878, partial [Pristionchus fissidentatus]
HDLVSTLPSSIFPFFPFSHVDMSIGNPSIERGTLTIEGPGERVSYSGCLIGSSSSSSVFDTSVFFPVSIVSLPSSSCLIALSTSVPSSWGETREPSNFMGSGGGGGGNGTRWSTHHNSLPFTFPSLNFSSSFSHLSFSSFTVSSSPQVSI